MKTPKFVGKSGNNFWVENYTEADKVFFQGLGFREKVYPGFSELKTLEFTGSKMFGLWTDAEKAKITTAVFDHYQIPKITVNPFVER